MIKLAFHHVALALIPGCRWQAGNGHRLTLRRHGQHTLLRSFPAMQARCWLGALPLAMRHDGNGPASSTCCKSFNGVGCRWPNALICVEPVNRIQRFSARQFSGVR